MFLHRITEIDLGHESIIQKLLKKKNKIQQQKNFQIFIKKSK